MPPSCWSDWRPTRSRNAPRKQERPQCWLSWPMQSHPGDRIGDQVGVALGVSGQAADRRLDEAARAHQAHPLLVDVHGLGLVSTSGVSALLEAVAGLSAESTTRVVAGVLDRLGRPAIPRSLPACAPRSTLVEHREARKALAAQPLSRMTRDDLAGIGAEQRSRMRAHATPGQLKRWAGQEIAKLPTEAVEDASRAGQRTPASSWVHDGGWHGIPLDPRKCRGEPGVLRAHRRDRQAPPCAAHDGAADHRRRTPSPRWTCCVRPWRTT